MRQRCPLGKRCSKWAIVLVKLCLLRIRKTRTNEHCPQTRNSRTQEVHYCRTTFRHLAAIASSWVTSMPWSGKRSWRKAQQHGECQQALLGYIPHRNRSLQFWANTWEEGAFLSRQGPRGTNPLETSAYLVVKMILFAIVAQGCNPSQTGVAKTFAASELGVDSHA